MKMRSGGRFPAAFFFGRSGVVSVAAICRGRVGCPDLQLLEAMAQTGALPATGSISLRLKISPFVATGARRWTIEKLYGATWFADDLFCKRLPEWLRPGPCAARSFKALTPPLA
jgi:hypothetical protein